MVKKTWLLFVLLSSWCRLFPQGTFPSNGAPSPVHSLHAFINATLYTDYQTVLSKGMMLVRDGKIVEVGQNLSIPADAIVHDLKGRFVYPSFIDLYSEYGMPESRPAQRHGGPQMENAVKGAYGWNQAIRSNAESHKLFAHNTQQAELYRKSGFGTVLCCVKDGIVRGSGVLVNLNDKKENESVLADKAAAFYSFNKGSSSQDYPNSLTGAIALLRQTYYDAQWYAANTTRTEYNITLEEFNKLRALPAIFDAGDKFNALRVARLGKEFNVKYVVKGSGNEYQRIDDIRNTYLKFVIPLNFPDAYDVEDPYDADAISYTELKHWELAPANPGLLEKAGVVFCITSADLKDKSQFLKNLRKAVNYGLSEKAALKALTVNPALVVNASDRCGALKKGYYANFFICNRPLFEDDARIMEHWVNGEHDAYEDLQAPDLRGNYLLSAGTRTFAVKLTQDPFKPTAQVLVDTTHKKLAYTFTDNRLAFSFRPDSNSVMRVSGVYSAERMRFDGKGQWENGDWFDFSMVFTSATDTAAKKPATKNEVPAVGKIIYPFTAFGEPLPEEAGVFKDSWNKFKGRYGAILIKNATVWTNRDSVLRNHDVYVVDGKIVRIAPNIEVPKLAFAKVIDGTGKHLTPGIIDEHSHIALTAGVNEGTQASSAEVRMGDVINPDDINIYRQLSGGVTTAQLLHGSANPIGGQSALIKLRWGHSAEDMKFDGADGFIKFALGENVKQSNWGDLNTVRFPQSRMGVEQVYMDFFSRAREYDKKMQSYAKLSARELALTPGAPRRDLELDALAEVLNGKRFITCHSYVQSEINMLIHVADSFGFRVNTFTHILEGYKVADKMKAHGCGASTFSDWWAYKNEVLDAIPYNAAILSKMGLITAINSDDAEMARRLNQEAGKCVKYGGLSEVEALKLVTLNPARLLHIDDRVGSIAPGKEADLVLWTDHPLSIYAKADRTIIDGRIYFDRDEDLKLREAIKAERSRIIALMLNEKQKGNKVIKYESREQRLYHCNTVEGVDEALTGHR